MKIRNVALAISASTISALRYFDSHPSHFHENFSLWYFTNPEFWPNLKKIALKTRCRKYPKRKSWKAKNVQMLLFIICKAPPKNSTIFRPFLAIFTLFHFTNWPYLQKPQLGNLGETRFWLLLVNNELCSIPLSFARSEI